MIILFYTLLLGVIVFGLTWLFINTPAATQARFFAHSGPIGLIGIGAVLTLLGRGVIGIPLAGLGLAWWRRARGIAQMSSPSGGRQSTVRSAAFEMRLDHETGEMDGEILTGRHEGKSLSDLRDEQLFDLLSEVNSDEESLALFESYLDRRIPSWREDAQSHTGGWQGAAPASGSMTKEEAYQVLGLQPGASPGEIQAAWRKLMKSVHPDSGGSEFLAAKINAAKDILLD